MTQARDLANFISNGLADTAEVADGAITEAKLASASVTDTKVASGITGTKINYDNSVSGISANTMQEAVDYLNALSGGSSGSVASYTRSKFTATAGQTTFAVTYQVGYLEVYLNGVLLDITDYAASDGTSVVLAVGASAGDEIVTIALDSFAIAELLRIFSTSASAPDDSVTVDASGNLLVGKTSANFSNAGIQLQPATASSFTQDGVQPLVLNRLTSDGDILKLFKDGTTVGSIGSGGSSTQLIIKSEFNGGALMLSWDKTDGTQKYLAHAEDWVASTTGQSGTIDLGQANRTFKDLYLSGGVYLGGTGAANLLDDYEEGSFTAYLNDTLGNTSSTSFTGSYVKVGQIVSVCVYLTNIDVTGMEGTSSVSMTLPFTANNSVSDANYWVGNAILDRVSLGSYVSVCPRTSGASSSLAFRLTGDNVPDGAFPWSYLNSANTSDIFVSITYQTA